MTKSRNTKFNIMDLAILVVIIIVVGSFLVKGAVSGLFNKLQDRVDVEIVLTYDSQKRPDISEGDRIIYGGDLVLGTVESLEVKESPDASGVFSVVIDLASMGKSTDSGFLFGQDLVLNNGNTLLVTVNGVDITVAVLDIALK